VRDGCRFVALRNSLPLPILETEGCSMPIAGHSKAAGHAVEQASSSFVEDAVQLFCQGLRGLVELNEAACLKFDIRSL
jgi:hypothetical protein